MGDRTAFQCYIYACPDDQQAAAAAVLADLDTESEPGSRYIVTDDTQNTEGEPIRAGQEPRKAGDFPTSDLAETFTAGQADPGRYSIDRVPGLAVGAEYYDHTASVGSATEYADNLIDAAPGCCFVLWEDPAYQWLGDVIAYTPELDRFTAECDSNGQPVYNRREIAAMIAKAAEAGEDPAEYIERATGGPWFDHWRES